MTRQLFPERIETDRLLLERCCSETVDPHELYDLTRTDAWQEEVTEHMPWFRFTRLDQTAEYIANREEKWAEREAAGYLIRPKEGQPHAGELVGLTNYGPEWDERRAGCGILLAKKAWGNGYGVERASAFIELTFERFDLDCFYTEVAAGNDASQRMIREYVDRFGGQHDGLMRHHSGRPSGEVTDQHRFTILREEYEESAASDETWARLPGE